MFADLLHSRPAPPNRVGCHTGELEEHLPEGAVMVAFAMHLFREHGATVVSINPDGMHARNFPFKTWLENQGFRWSSGLGSTTYGGVYRDADGREVLLNPKSGEGDVSATLPQGSIVAEAKGGCMNTRHGGQLSRLRRGLCEAVGQLLGRDLKLGERQVAVVPKTELTERLARNLTARVRTAGIEIALVDGRGNVSYLPQ